MLLSPVQVPRQHCPGQIGVCISQGLFREMQPERYGKRERKRERERETQERGREIHVKELGYVILEAGIPDFLFQDK